MLTRLCSDTHCECSKSIAYVTRPADIEYSQRITERSPNNIYIHILNYMADIFIKQVYIEKVYIWVKANDAQIIKKQRSRNVRDICIIFLQKIDKQLLVLYRCI